LKLSKIPEGVIDWTEMTAMTRPGESGEATARAWQLGDIRPRRVKYSPEYVADHWCGKGHVLIVLDGAVVLEHQDGRQFTVGEGATYHVADDSKSPHRVISEHGATVFIVD